LNESRGQVFGPSGAAATLGMQGSTVESKIRFTEDQLESLQGLRCNSLSPVSRIGSMMLPRTSCSVDCRTAAPRRWMPKCYSEPKGYFFSRVWNRSERFRCCFAMVKIRGTPRMRSHISVRRATTKYFSNSFVFKTEIEEEGLPGDITPALGAGGPRFESGRPDQTFQTLSRVIH
jgi:hypothetical protein